MPFFVGSGARLGADLIDKAALPVGRMGLSAERVLRCLLLKQQLRISYKQLAFHLSDSVTYRALKHFCAGVEGNISDLKRAFGATKAR